MSNGNGRLEPRHPIAVVAERTGLSQDVLRVWERRYGAVKTRRTSGGHRLYSDADIERLRLMRAAVEGGRRIGQVAEMSDEELQRLLEEDRAASAQRVIAPLVDDGESDVVVIERALGHVRAFDARALNDHLRRNAALLGAQAFLDRVVAPLMRRVGDEWHAGSLSVAEEHLASAVVGDFTYEIMRALAGSEDAPRILVATPAGSRHLIGAVLVGAAAAAEGWGVVYVGGDLPEEDIAAAAITRGVKVVAMSVVYADDVERALERLTALRRELPPSILLLAGGRALQPHADKLRRAGIGFGEDLHALRQQLAGV